MSNVNNSSWSQSNGEGNRSNAEGGSVNSSQFQTQTQDESGNYRRGTNEFRRGNSRYNKNGRNYDNSYSYRNNGPNYSMNNMFNNSRVWNNNGFNRRDRGGFKDSNNSSRRSSPSRNYQSDYDETNTMPKYRSAGTAPNKNSYNNYQYPRKDSYYKDSKQPYDYAQSGNNDKKRNDYNRDGEYRNSENFSDAVMLTSANTMGKQSGTPSPDSGVSYSTVDSTTVAALTSAPLPSLQQPMCVQQMADARYLDHLADIFPRETTNGQSSATHAATIEMLRKKQEETIKAMQQMNIYSHPLTAHVSGAIPQLTIPNQKFNSKSISIPGSNVWVSGGGSALVQKSTLTPEELERLLPKKKSKDQEKKDSKKQDEKQEKVKEEPEVPEQKTEKLINPQMNRVSYSSVLRRGSSSSQEAPDLKKDLIAGSFPLPDLESASNLAKTLSEDQQQSPASKPPPQPSGLFSEKGKYEVSKMDVLSETIWHYHTRVEQTEATLAKKLSLRDMLYNAIAPLFPMCGLYVVGSSLNGFGNNSSDMDLCLMITNKELDQRSDAVVVLNMILYQLQSEKFVAQQQLILAKVPILRITFAEPYEDITVDLNANNSVAIKNTHLLCYYSSFDWRVRPIVSVVKEWAKRKGINDANHSTFTSYSLVLMVIHYLQCGAQPAVLPSLQLLYRDRFKRSCDVRSLNVTLPLPLTSKDEWKFNETSTLAELLIGFLDYYANQFDYDRDAISIREGRRIEKIQLARQRAGATPSTSTSSISLNATADTEATTVAVPVPSTTTTVPPSSSSAPASSSPPTSSTVIQPPASIYQPHPMAWQTQWRCICIEEPFTQTNTAHSIYDENVFSAIKEAFREAHTQLNNQRDLSKLMECKPISVKGPGAGAVVYYAQYNERPIPAAVPATASGSTVPSVIPPSAVSSAVHANLSASTNGDSASNAISTTTSGKNGQNNRSRVNSNVYTGETRGNTSRNSSQKTNTTTLQSRERKNDEEKENVKKTKAV